MIFQRDYILRIIEQLGEAVCLLNEAVRELDKERLLAGLYR